MLPLIAFLFFSTIARAQLVVPDTVEIFEPLESALQPSIRKFYLLQLDRAANLVGRLSDEESRTAFKWEGDASPLKGKSLRFYLTVASDPLTGGIFLPPDATSGIRVQTFGPFAEITVFLILDRIFVDPKGFPRKDAFLDLFHAMAGNLGGAVPYFLDMPMERLQRGLNPMQQRNLANAKTAAALKALRRLDSEPRFQNMLPGDRARLTQLLKDEEAGSQKSCHRGMLN